MPIVSTLCQIGSPLLAVRNFYENKIHPCKEADTTDDNSYDERFPIFFRSIVGFVLCVAGGGIGSVFFFRASGDGGVTLRIHDGESRAIICIDDIGRADFTGAVGIRYFSDDIFTLGKGGQLGKRNALFCIGNGCGERQYNQSGIGGNDIAIS